MTASGRSGHLCGRVEVGRAPYIRPPRMAAFGAKPTMADRSASTSISERSNSRIVARRPSARCRKRTFAVRACPRTPTSPAPGRRTRHWPVPAAAYADLGPLRGRRTPTSASPGVGARRQTAPRGQPRQAGFWPAAPRLCVTRPSHASPARLDAPRLFGYNTGSCEQGEMPGTMRRTTSGRTDRAPRDAPGLRRVRRAAPPRLSFRAAAEYQDAPT